ncbi:MAG: hypothetical protein ACI9FN_004024, partial [Saprospiraceae bacterium]
MKTLIILIFLSLSLSLMAQDVPCDSTVLSVAEPITQADTIASSDTLFLSSTVSGSPVLTQSQVMICFESGFEVLASVVFEANIDECISEFSLPQIFEGNIDLANLENYENQVIPNYINEDNTDGNPVSNIGAALGRVL